MTLAFDPKVPEVCHSAVLQEWSRLLSRLRFDGASLLHHQLQIVTIFVTAGSNCGGETFVIDPRVGLNLERALELLDLQWFEILTMPELVAELLHSSGERDVFDFESVSHGFEWTCLP